MSRALACCTVLALLAVPCRAGEPASNPETLIRLDVRPAPAPEPALRYLLLPELDEIEPGNPVYNYLRCCMEQQAFLFDTEAFRRREELLAMPITELPAKDLQEYGRSALSQADWAARLDRPDWQILPRLKEDGFFTLLPDVQQMRALARALKVRFRAEVALGHFDDAIRTAKTMFAMARHLGEHPSLIGNLVGIAITSITIEPLEEMLQQPGCPNLYWALTNLPDPFISLEKGIDGERAMLQAEFREVDDKAPMSPARVQAFVARMEKVVGEEGPIKSAKGVRGWLDARTKDVAKVAAARRRLVEHGLPEERVASFPADQVILLEEKLECDIRRDDAMKLMRFPFVQAEALAASQPKRPPAPLADTLVPVTKAVRRAQARLEQRFGLLRHVEALRLYAAAHDGKVPAALSEISVPLPNDPFSGKPFRYERIGATAHLRGSPPSGEEKVPIYNMHYELTIRK